MNHIVIASPQYGGMCTGLFANSCIPLPLLAKERGVEVSFSHLYNESLIQRGRNLLAHQFLKRPETTHLMFIDADIQFHAEDVFSLMEADKDVICGLYPKKEINWPMVHQAALAGVPANELHRWTGAIVVNLPGMVGQMTVARTEPFEIVAGGTGFMMIKRATLEALSPPTYINDVRDLSGNVGQDEIREFFPVCIEPESRRLLSEDYAFCKMVRDAGMKVWAAPWVELGHFGSYLFSGALTPAP